MARIREQNEKIKQRRIVCIPSIIISSANHTLQDVQADEEAWNKNAQEDQVRSARHAKQQNDINTVREQNARRKMDKATNREWDSAKPARGTGAGERRGRGGGRPSQQQPTDTWQHDGGGWTAADQATTDGAPVASGDTAAPTNPWAAVGQTVEWGAADNDAVSKATNWGTSDSAEGQSSGPSGRGRGDVRGRGGRGEGRARGRGRGEGPARGRGGRSPTDSNPEPATKETTGEDSAPTRGRGGGRGRGTRGRGAKPPGEESSGDPPAATDSNDQSRGAGRGRGHGRGRGGRGTSNPAE